MELDARLINQEIRNVLGSDKPVDNEYRRGWVEALFAVEALMIALEKGEEVENVFDRDKNVCKHYWVERVTSGNVPLSPMTAFVPERTVTWVCKHCGVSKEEWDMNRGSKK